MKSLCETDEVKNMAGKECKGFTVYPTDKFYAVPWWKWRMYFDEGSTENVFNLSANSYVVHVWNKHSEQSKVPISSQTSYLLYAKRHCPKVIQECHEYF